MRQTQNIHIMLISRTVCFFYQKLYCSICVSSHNPNICYVELSQFQLLPTSGMSDVGNVLSSAALLSSYSLVPVASLMDSTHLVFGLPLFLLPSVFPALLCFPKNPTSHDMPEIGQL